jgi:TP901 family phage tail tape measure protein
MPAAQGIRAGRAFVELGVSDKLTSGLRRAQRRLRAFGDGVRALGTRLVGISAAVATPLAVSTSVFATFEQRMARVQALTGAAGKDFARLAAEAKRLGESTTFSASQAADAMSAFALAGYDVEQILKAIGPTLDLAAAGQLDVATGADIAAKIMAGLGLEAEQLGGAVDVLTKAMTTANTDLVMLGDAMKYVGPIAKSAGIAFEEITAAVQLLSNAGIQGDMAGTTLRGAILALTSPSVEARQTLERLGVAVTDAQGDVRPLADIIGDLNAAMDGLGAGERLDVLGRIFQARQAAGVAELLSQGADKLREYTAALQDAGGTAARIASVQLNTLQGDATILRSALEGLAIAVGEALVAPVRVLTRLLTQVVAATAQWLRDNRELVILVAALAAGVGAVGVALVSLGLAAQVAAFVVGGLATILAGVKLALAGVVAGLGALLSPIGLVVAAVAGLGTAFVIYSGAAGEAIRWLGEQFERLRGFVSEVTTGMTDALAAGDVALAARVLWLSLQLIWEQGVATLQRAWLEAQRFFVGTAQRMWFGALALAQQTLFALEVAWIETTAFLSRTWTSFTAGFQKAWNTAINWTTKRLLELFGLFDETLDVGAAQRMADDDLAAMNAEIDRRREAALAAREDRRRRERDDARELNDATLAEIGRQFEEAQSALDSDSEERIARTRAALAAARRQLDDALAAARRKRNEVDAAPEPGQPKDPLAGLQARLAGLGDVIARQISVTGTFNAVAAVGLGGGGAVERTARATEETARHTKRLVDATATGRLTFS